MNSVLPNPAVLSATASLARVGAVHRTPVALDQLRLKGQYEGIAGPARASTAFKATAMSLLVLALAGGGTYFHFVEEVNDKTTAALRPTNLSPAVKTSTAVAGQTQSRDITSDAS